MLEALKKIFKPRGKIVEQGLVWRCTECNHVFLTKTTAEKHPCPDQKVN
jgi:rubrerythrin